LFVKSIVLRLVLEDNGSDDLTIGGTGTVNFTFKALATNYNEAATSVPGARWGSAGWVSPDNGNLFLFGGFGYGSDKTQPTGFLNDVWEYDFGTG
jgi:hypothetical protein